jgi:hypothetical protein
VRNNERYLVFPPAVTQAFLEVSYLCAQSFLFTFSTVRNTAGAGARRLFLERVRAARSAVPEYHHTIFQI